MNGGTEKKRSFLPALLICLGIALVLEFALWNGGFLLSGTNVVDQQKTPQAQKAPLVRGLFGRGFFDFFDFGFDIPEREFAVPLEKYH